MDAKESLVVYGNTLPDAAPDGLRITVAELHELYKTQSGGAASV